MINNMFYLLVFFSYTYIFLFNVKRSMASVNIINQFIRFALCKRLLYGCNKTKVSILKVGRR